MKSVNRLLEIWAYGDTPTEELALELKSEHGDDLEAVLSDVEIMTAKALESGLDKKTAAAAVLAHLETKGLKSGE